MTAGEGEGIVLSGIGIDFPTRAGVFTALDGIDAVIPDRGFTTLLGPSGCGKSTLLRIISDILTPTRGSVNLLGRTPAQARRDGDFGFVFQDPVLLPWRTARENVELPLQAAAVSRPERRQRAMELLHLVGLDGFEDNPPAKLSGGMARRVAIARALAMSPRVLFLDEPFSGLDELRRQQMNGELQRIWTETGTTAVLVTHNVSEAVFLSDQVFVMAPKPGRIIARRTIDLPRPRSLDMVRTDEFLSYEDDLTDLLSSAYRGSDE